MKKKKKNQTKDKRPRRQNKRKRKRIKQKKIKEVEDKIKEQQKSKFEKELLSYVSSISIPVKPIKYFVKKNTSHIINMKNTKTKIKPMKIRKQPGTTYYFGCKDFTYNFRPQEEKNDK